MMDTEDMFNSATEETEEYEEELTAAEVLHKLEEAWINEKQAPELLGKYRNQIRPHRQTRRVTCDVQSQKWRLLSACWTK